MNILNAIPPFAIAVFMAALLILLVYLVVSSVLKKQAAAKAEAEAQAKRAAQPPKPKPPSMDDIFPRLGSRPAPRNFAPVAKASDEEVLPLDQEDPRVAAAMYKKRVPPMTGVWAEKPTLKPVRGNPQVSVASRGERLVAVAKPNAVIEDTTVSIFASDDVLTVEEASEPFFHSHRVVLEPYEGPMGHSHKVPEIREIEESAHSRAQDEPRQVPPTAPDEDDHRPKWDDDSSSSSSSSDD